ncbi:beta-lactamase hydrolase domain-containing protein [Maricaulis sp.]|uniref:beta-lactamase hydrolase domain-containing protein n=1 Tax=Maricaulis sp. TaxID=1486257 RepID=UPI003A93BA70
MSNFLVSFLSLFGVAMSEPNSDSIVSRHGDVWLASQPSEADLDAWAAAGVGLVVNSRTPEETASLPFDMRAAAESRGMRYAELPIGGASGASPALTGELARLLEASEGPVVLHCRSGTRSAHLYAAYLVTGDRALSTPFDTMNWPGGRDMGMVRALTPPPVE